MPENAAPKQPGQNDGAHTGAGTGTQSFTKVGMRKADIFGPNYERMGVEAATQICSTHGSIEQYVKLSYGYLE